MAFFGCGFGDAQDRDALGEGELFEVAEDEDFPVCRIEPGEGCPNACTQLVAQEASDGAGAAGEDSIEPVGPYPPLIFPS